MVEWLHVGLRFVGVDPKLTLLRRTETRHFVFNQQCQAERNGELEKVRARKCLEICKSYYHLDLIQLDPDGTKDHS